MNTKMNTKMAEEDYREAKRRLESIGSDQYRIDDSLKDLEDRITKQEEATPIWDFFVKICIYGLMGYAIWWFLFEYL